MKIKNVTPQANCILKIVAADGRVGSFDVNPYLKYEAFTELTNPNEFVRVSNGKFFIEWDCGADLSVDTIEARWQVA